MAGVGVEQDRPSCGLQPKPDYADLKKNYEVEYKEMSFLIQLQKAS